MFKSAEFCVSLKQYNEQIARTTLVICIIRDGKNSSHSLTHTQTHTSHFLSFCRSNMLSIREKIRIGIFRMVRQNERKGPYHE